jgi:hypothetical protein
VQPVYHYVKQGGSGSGSGASWANASGDIQAMIDAVALNSIGGEVWVAAGKYVPGSTTGDTFTLKDKVKVYGGFPAGITDSTTRTTAMSERNARFNTDGTIKSGSAACETILSGDIDNDDTYAADTGFVSNYSDNATNVVTGATGAFLDGFTVKGASGNGINNPGTNTAGISSLVLANLTIAGNYGNGIDNVYTSSLLTNVTIKSNNGDGMCHSDYDTEILINVVIAGNNGVGMDNYYGDITLINVLVTGNNKGGIVHYAYDHDANFFNVTVAGNKEYGVKITRGYVTCHNCIIWGNESNIVRGSSGGTQGWIDLNYSLVNVSAWSDVCVNAAGSIISTADPFVAAQLYSAAPTTAGIYQLKDGSAAIDTGNDTTYNALSAPSIWAATGLNWATPLAKDLAGAQRPVGDHIDMGAYEKQ